MKAYLDSPMKQMKFNVMLVLLSWEISLIESSICPEYKFCVCRLNADKYDVYCKNVADLQMVRRLLDSHFKNRPINKLVMVNCTVETIPNDLFSNFSITILHSECPIVSVEDNALSLVRNLSQIDLFYSKFEELPLGVLNLNKLVSLNIRGGKISRITDQLKHLNSLRYLTIRQSALQTLNNDAFSYSPYIEHLDLSVNKLSVVPDLGQLKNLKRIMLRENQLTCIDGIFDGLNPELIDAYNNRLTNISEAFHDNMWALNRLNLGKNYLTFLNASEISGKFVNLKSLDLSENQLKSVDGAFRSLLNLEVLDLGDNKLMTLSEDTLPRTTNLKELHLGSGNEWICDCRILWLVTWLNNTGGEFLKDEPLCHFPEYLWLKNFRNLTSHDLVDWPKKCPTQCACQCRTKGRDFYVYVDCSNKGVDIVPETLPDYLGELNLQGNNIQNITTDEFSDMKTLFVLNLAGNQLKTFELNLPVSLKILKLNDNQLLRFPMKSLNNATLEEITLSGNQWICDCMTVEFRSFLLTSIDKVADINQTRCADLNVNGVLRNKVVIDLKDTDLCPSKLKFYVAIIIGGLVVLLLATLTVVVYCQYELYIKVWLYARGFGFVKEKDLDGDREYDAFLSYSQMDHDFVWNDLVPGLEEGEPNYMLFIPERDLLPDEINVGSLLLILEKCKKIIIIFTRNYLDDMLVTNLYEVAFSILQEDQIKRFILIEYELPPETELKENTIKTALNARKPIIWGEKMFWEELRYALPEK